ncbi:GNAT family N-acetyltransferase [Photobacterium ganghwense]|uniref:GNAT family N-acetyltransferase n=1 Tax=Photobacterium ganghwense TaxID=320778 RepID=UPI0039F0D090
MPFDIVPASLAEASAINGLTHELGYPAENAETTAWLAALLDSEHHVVLLATSKETVIGWLVAEKRLTLESGFKGEITGLVVDVRYRGSGAGRQLVQAALQWAQEAGLERLVVRSNIQRTVSHQFYESLGFRRIKTAHCYEYLG